MKHIAVLLFLMAMGMSLHLEAIDLPKGNQRAKYNFNPDWRLFVGDPQGAESAGFDDSSWKPVTLPYAYNENEAFEKSIYDLTTGVVWYRKHFKLPEKYQFEKVFLEFEGIRQGGEFFINGKSIGIHENGVMAVGFDVTGLVHFGTEENVIAVRIDNSWKYKERATGTTFQWNDRNFNANYGGIPKNVYLHFMGRLYQTLPLYTHLKTTGVYVYAQNFDIAGKSADITAETQVKNEFPIPKTYRFDVVIDDMDGKTIQTFSGGNYEIGPGVTQNIMASAHVEGLNFWSWGYGYLYHVYTILKVNGKPVDVVNTTTGFRKTAFHDGMIWLNDRVIQMKGYAQRTTNEWPAVGMSVPAWMSDFSNRLMVDGNASLVRWMHVTPWKQDVESCDRVGLIESMPAGDAEHDSKGRQWEQRTELMADAIIYNRNNPSIVFYECGNKAISEGHMQQMKDIRDKYDPHGGRAIGSREMLDSKVAEYGGEMLYINKSAHIPMWAMEYSRDEGLRKYWDNYTPPFHRDGDGPLYKGQDASVYNRNQDSQAIEDVARWYDYWRERPGTGKRASSGGVNIIFSDSNTHFRGAENYRRSGEVDAMRIPKDGYFANQVMWDGWVDTEKQHTHILGHWNYTDTVTKDVYVVSTGRKVELFLNHVSLGWGTQSYRFLYTFRNIHWMPGTIKAVSYDDQGKMASADSIVTAGTPSNIRLTLHTGPKGLKADGADIALVDVEVTDARGYRCPTSNQMIHFKLNGQAEWLGGIAQGPGNYIMAESLPVECGINRVMVRSTTRAGKINLTATADGLKTATVSLKSLPVKDLDGLSIDLPGEDLPSNFGRGPTPPTPSFTVKRIPVDIDSATAGVHEDQVKNSYDDNELTEWTNDGHLNTGWITYHLARPAVLNECVIKLTGWRTRSYPLKIFVDSMLVYNDTTPRSLGYVTLPLKPVKGQTVTIQLAGMNTEKDAFGQIVEITGTKELDLYKDPQAGNAKGQLRIVEVEFYEKKN